MIYDIDVLLVRLDRALVLVVEDRWSAARCKGVRVEMLKFTWLRCSRRQCGKKGKLSKPCMN